MRQIISYAICLPLAFGAACAGTAEVAPGGSVVGMTADRSSDPVIHDLGLLKPPANSDTPTPAPSSLSDVNNGDATPVPELPTWAMMLLCLAGLGLAGFKKGRKDRLSPGIE